MPYIETYFTNIKLAMFHVTGNRVAICLYPEMI